MCGLESLTKLSKILQLILKPVVKFPLILK